MQIAERRCAARSARGAGRDRALRPLDGARTLAGPAAGAGPPLPGEGVSHRRRRAAPPGRAAGRTAESA